MSRCYHIRDNQRYNPCAMRLHALWLSTLAAVACDSSRPAVQDAGAPPPVCPKQVPRRCFDRGLSLLDQDPARAALAFAHACDGQIPEGCNNLGQLYATGRGVAKNLVQAQQLYQQACDGGSPHGCYALSSLHQADASKSFELANRACSLGHMQACDRVGVAYANGQGVDMDKLKAMKLWDQACTGGVNHACAAMGINLVLGIHGVTKDVARGESLLMLACNANHAAACKDLGGLHLSGVLPNSEPAKGVLLLGNACNLSYGEGCNELGVVYMQGVGVDADAARGASLLDRACKLGSMTGCFNLAVAYQHGDGVAIDAARSTKLLEQACRGGHEPGCEAIQQR